ncbi:sigma-w pathway protein ysdB [Bacillus daqingensis]|uniref:Sigma-w pathway protein ysdB n=1 Tax=Bacillus daqingensis TaxID=872396 RepID=A0ABV9NXA2_9BACI
MMTVILFRLFLLIAVGIIAFSIIKYITDPTRKLERARRNHDFYVLDDPENVRRHLFITTQGAMFEGEKFLGTADQSVEVTTIVIQAENLDELRGMTLADFETMEKEILVRYPKASIEWGLPVHDIIKRLRNQQKQSKT